VLVSTEVIATKTQEITVKYLKTKIYKIYVTSKVQEPSPVNFPTKFPVSIPVPKSVTPTSQNLLKTQFPPKNYNSPTSTPMTKTPSTMICNLFKVPKVITYSQIKSHLLISIFKINVLIKFNSSVILIFV
jgi:hypothetical protein